jgi:hypothetical protein
MALDLAGSLSAARRQEEALETYCVLLCCGEGVDKNEIRVRK